MKRGYTLVEVVMAIFISAIVVTAVFSVVLSSRSGTRAGARKQKAYMVINGVLNDLKNYVTADPNPCTSQNPDCMTGPVNPFNSSGCDKNTWGLIDDYCGGNCRGNDNLLPASTLDTCRSVIAGDPRGYPFDTFCWALQENCFHDVSERLPCYWGGIPGYSRGCSAVHLCEDGGNDLCWNDPTQARLTYVVTLNPDQSRKVVVTASWNE